MAAFPGLASCALNQRGQTLALLVQNTCETLKIKFASSCTVSPPICSATTLTGTMTEAAQLTEEQIAEFKEAFA